MGMDISKIQNAELKALAAEVDSRVNKNNFIDTGDEISELLNRAKTELKYEKDADILKDMMGYTTNPADKDSSISEKKTKAEKKSEERQSRVDKRREELSHITKEDFYKLIKHNWFRSIFSRNKSNKAFMKKLENFMEQNKNDDGTYNLSKLTDYVLYRVSSNDNVLNGSKDKERSEKTWVAREINAQGISDEQFDEKDVKILCKICDIDMVEKDHSGAIKKGGKAALKSLIPGAVGGVGAYLATKNKLSVDLLVEVFNDVNLLNSLGISSEDGIDVKQDVDWDIVVKKPNVMKKLIKGALAGALGAGLTSLVLEAAKVWIIGNPIEFEKTCFSTDDYDINNERYTNLNKYKEYLTKTNPNALVFLNDILEAYRDDADGKWDHAAFFNQLRKAAGLGSNLNCAELAKLKVPERKPNPKETEPQIYLAEEEVVEHVEEEAPKKIDVPTFKSSHSSWEVIANQYDCLVQKYGLEKAKRYMKLAQAIKDGDYSEERMEDLYNKSRKGTAALANLEYFDVEVYRSLLKATVMPKQVKLPENIAGCDRKSISADANELKSRKLGGGKKVKAPSNPAQDMTKGKDAYDKKSKKYHSNIDGKNKTYKEDQLRDREKDVNDYINKNPKAKVNDYGNNMDKYRKETEKED